VRFASFAHCGLAGQLFEHPNVLPIVCHALNAARVAASDLGSLTFMVTASGRIRLINPLNTVAGPTSTNVVTPIAAITFTESSQSTDEGSCRTNDVWMSFAFVMALASALFTNGILRS